MKSRFAEALERAPIIAAIKDTDRLDAAIDAGPAIIFLLTSNIFNLKEVIDRVKKANIYVCVHFDLVEGLSRDTTGLKYLIDTMKPDGIISTKGNLIKYAKDQGVFSIQRFFLLDSLNMTTAVKSILVNQPDAVEILPGVMHKITKQMVEKTHAMVITGGLIQDKEDVINSLKAGAKGISTSREEIWRM